MRQMPRMAIVLPLFAAGLSCDVFVKTPRAEVVLVVDTDLRVPDLVGTLRVDVFREHDGPQSYFGLEWTESNEFVLEDRRDWPASFAVALAPELSHARHFVRLRLFRSGRKREYLGERFLERPTALGAPDEVFAPPSPPEGNVPRWITESGDRTPSDEPSPSLTVDQLVTFEIREGERKVGDVFMAGDCAGTQADLAGRRTCADGGLAPALELALTEDRKLPRAGVETHVGEWPVASGPRIAVDCGAPEVEAQRRKESGLLDEEVCVPGGAFLFGDRRWGDGEIAGSKDTAGLSDERIVAVPRFFVDRYEYSVARAKKSPLARELFANDDELDFGGLQSACTFSRTASGRDTYPLNCIPDVQAVSLCAAEGRTLTTMAAWQYVATNAHATRTDWPWGDAMPDNDCRASVVARRPPFTCGLGVIALDEPTFAKVERTDISQLGVRDLVGSLREIQADAGFPFGARCWLTESAVMPTCHADGPLWRLGSSWANGLQDFHFMPQLETLTFHSGFDTGSIDAGLRCMRAIPER